MEESKIPYFDVLIIGAGLSGIGAAYHLQEKCPSKTYAILEARAALGGTWDLFRYPGIRSDSDMHTLGFSFNPWKNPKAIADGPSILKYIEDTAQKFGIAQNIRYQHKVLRTSWSSEKKCWTLQIETAEGESNSLQCAYLFACSGYYDYEQGHDPSFPNIQDFEGIIVHPQKWDERIDYKDKEVVIIGSGATAITLVPEMAKDAKMVTMLQRSPSYIKSLPSKDAFANFLRKVLPSKLAYRLSRWRNILVSQFFYQATRRWPKATRKFLLKEARKEVGEDFDMQHLSPKYNPWDQRLCVAPDGDIFKTLRAGKAEIVTDHIESFNAQGILLKSGKQLNADIVVKATGLKIKLLGGILIDIDGQQLQPNQLHCYRGVLFSQIPNFAVAIGYTNASWTLKCDLSCHYVTRILNYMDKKGYKVCTPRFDAEEMESEPLLNFEAGYIQRALDQVPRQGSKSPWRVYQNYILDSFTLKYKSAVDKYLEFE